MQNNSLVGVLINKIIKNDINPKIADIVNSEYKKYIR